MSRKDSNKDLPQLKPTTTHHKKSSKKKRAGMSVLAILSAAGVIASSAFLMLFAMTTLFGADEPAVVEVPQYDQVKFAAMGDMLAHDSVVSQASSTGIYDFKPYFTDIRSLYGDADAVFCNPETPVAGETLGVSGYPTFNAPAEFARDMVDGAGCNVINLATNHMSDKGQAGINNSLAVWSKLDILAAAGANSNGLAQEQIQYFTKNNIKIAFLAFADFSNATPPHKYSINIYHDDALVEKLVNKARENADAVVVSAHWGTEAVGEVNDDQLRFANLLANLNVDVVIGTGPHVLQRADWMPGSNGHRTLVWYSIGNMLSSQLEPDELTGGVAGFTVRKQNGSVVVVDPTFKATFMSYDWSSSARAAETLEARSNLMLQPLSSAAKQIETMFPDLSLDERTTYVHEAIGDRAGVVFTP